MYYNLQRLYKQNCRCDIYIYTRHCLALTACSTCAFKALQIDSVPLMNDKSQDAGLGLLSTFRPVGFPLDTIY